MDSLNVTKDQITIGRNREVTIDNPELATALIQRNEDTLKFLDVKATDISISREGRVVIINDRLVAKLESIFERLKPDPDYVPPRIMQKCPIPPLPLVVCGRVYPDFAERFSFKTEVLQELKTEISANLKEEITAELTKEMVKEIRKS